MPLMLMLNFETMILPDDAPVATLLKVFQKAVMVDDRSWDTGDPRLVVRQPVRIEIGSIPVGVRFTDGRGGDEVDVPVSAGKVPGTGLAVSRRRRPARPTSFPLLDRDL